jgi:hypothetical protein
MSNDEWNCIIGRISKSVDVSLTNGASIPWFIRPLSSPPPSPRTKKAMDELDQALYEEVTWRSQIPNTVTVKLRYSISRILTINHYRDMIPKDEEFNAYVESIDRIMLSDSNSVDDYINMTSFKTRIIRAIKYKSFINKVKVI